MTTTRPDAGTTEQPTTDQQKPAETAVAGTEPPDPTEDTPDDAESFPREYVERLRAENAEQRTRARRADEMSRRLHLELVRATGRLADPDDLPYDEAHLEDVDVMAAAIDALIARKPHLADRRPRGTIGQGATAEQSTVDLAGLLRARAG